MKLNVFVTEQGITTLGPYKRFGLWVQGCHRDCPGCIAKMSHNEADGRLIDTGALSWEIIAAKEIEGLTISGGEPFLQASALAELIRKVKAFKDVGVIIYTGFLREELDALPGGTELLSLTDLLIDGPYIQSLDDGKSLRGSSNQRVHALTPRYAHLLHLYGAEGRPTEEFLHSGMINTVGIPNHAATHTDFDKPIR
jgi:anaerobic ribonucleoside-triphosphate reductase activating protein